MSLLFDDVIYSHPLLFHGNILRNPFCQGHCVYVKTQIAAIRYIKRTGLLQEHLKGIVYT